VRGKVSAQALGSFNYWTEIGARLRGRLGLPWWAVESLFRAPHIVDVAVLAIAFAATT
jgi:hypothetical protein